ncbi:MAG: 4-hydroxy-3-methylbut-2-enyl diphosphate reductase, partial [Lachnospiraceae bacterium]|nr:4-hydroxy-3-methylbut-2-enyl diphosphate reductase [Lachnospiraceae bacterium]
MEVIRAESAGFCFGVKKAVEKVYDQIHAHKKIYTYGPIIHNEEVVRDLESRGVMVIEGEEALGQLKEGAVVIRSHGVPKRIYELIEENGLECIDATCPFVKRIHNIVEKESLAGRQIVIIGNAGHPEVEGIMGWSASPALVIGDVGEAENFRLDKEKPICIVSQTTFNYNKFQELVEIFHKRGYNVNVVNTICNATEERQTQAREIAAKVDAMIVIGGRHSSNTQK